MFVGYEVKSNQPQKPITLPSDIKLSQAVLDPASKGNKKDPVCLMAEYEKKQFIIAVLDPSQSWQCPLDLMFTAGSEVKFSLKGSGTVHLTGFEYIDDYDDMSMSASSDEEFEDEEITSEEDEEEEEEPAKKKASSLKGSAKKSPKVNGVPKAIKNGKGKVAGDQAESDESDDENFEYPSSLDDEDEELNDEEEDDDEDDDDEDDDDDIDDEDEEMDELGELDEDSDE